MVKSLEFLVLETNLKDKADLFIQASVHFRVHLFRISQANAYYVPDVGRR